MGFGYEYKCEKCGREYSVVLGGGMLYPEDYKLFTDEIRQGKYGDKLKDLFLSTKYAAVNADRFLYYCENCGHWEVKQDLTIYAPKDPEKIAKKQYGIKNVEEWGEVPYMSAFDLKEDYRVLKRHYEKCSVCGNRMKKLSDCDDIVIKCPECGAPGIPVGAFLWD